ncbi:MAG: antibiotic biosynthesis monooxygenase [Desulfobulbaceae bacterium]|nr:antibiotic biosynthesis monooxygenase [Desulfobulbaceae bacterium]
MIRFEILVKIHSGKRTEFLQLFDMVKTPGQMIDGRLDLELFERVNDPNNFLWVEHWKDNQLLSLYYKQDRFRAMIGAINILGQLVHKKTFSFEEESQDA